MLASIVLLPILHCTPAWWAVVISQSNCFCKMYIFFKMSFINKKIIVVATRLEPLQLQFQTHYQIISNTTIYYLKIYNDDTYLKFSLRFEFGSKS